MERTEQIAWLRKLAADLVDYQATAIDPWTATDLVDYWGAFQDLAEMPAWYDDQDREMLIDLVAEELEK